ncbi:hypothetical protein BJ508DRAFT_48715 [Ascobolus immersus RN42]|uniref:Uncharacterized protein n=1 Tax=Ascobolus immersus RN42 TaxID=1160509 RepID=A0A3N4HHS2_ASCIM|nr:hypothetical protein BJ508DRAFT_48715 [Ascobolus immersus RN42]
MAPPVMSSSIEEPQLDHHQGQRTTTVISPPQHPAKPPKALKNRNLVQPTYFLISHPLPTNSRTKTVQANAIIYRKHAPPARWPVQKHHRNSNFPRSHHSSRSACPPCRLRRSLSPRSSYFLLPRRPRRPRRPHLDALLRCPRRHPTPTAHGSHSLRREVMRGWCTGREVIVAVQGLRVVAMVVLFLPALPLIMKATLSRKTGRSSSSFLLYEVTHQNIDLFG